MGLTRDEVFIGNIVKCRPPENRDPRPEEIISCWPYLKRQLELIAPQVIVALGAHAARTLLKTERPIGQLRGQFHQYEFSELLPPAKLMPTYHPAYLLRNYSTDNRRRVWEDMQKVMQELGMTLAEEVVGWAVSAVIAAGLLSGYLNMNSACPRPVELAEKHRLPRSQRKTAVLDHHLLAGSDQ